MDYHEQGAQTARQLFKVADILSTTAGRKLFSNAFQTVMSPDGKPRLVRTLEPYYREFILGEENPFDTVDNLHL